MFENEARERVKRKIYNFIVSDLGVYQIITGLTCETVEGMPHFYQYSLEKMWQEGAEYGYNKCKEELNQKGLALQSDMDKTIEQNIALKKELNNVKKWYYVKDGDYPKKKGIYLVAWKRTHHVEKYGEWGFDVDFFNADEGYFEWARDFVIAWKEIILPEQEG